MAPPQKTIHPVDTYHRAQKKRDQQKARETRDKRKRDDEEQRELHGAMEMELIELANTAAVRTLTALEKSRRKELKSGVEELRNKFGRPTFHSISGAAPGSGNTPVLVPGLSSSRYDNTSVPRRSGNDLPSGLFDPLSSEHESLHARSRKQLILVSTSTKESEEIKNPLVSCDLAGTSVSSDLLPDLPDDFMPFLPDEPFPPWYIFKNEPPKLRTMAGYPPPPQGSIPDYARTFNEIFATNRNESIHLGSAIKAVNLSSSTTKTFESKVLSKTTDLSSTSNLFSGYNDAQLSLINPMDQVGGTIKEIKAKPQIHNFSNESLLMVPTSVAFAKKSKRITAVGGGGGAVLNTTSSLSKTISDKGRAVRATQFPRQPEKLDEDMYESFLQEMGDLI